MTDKVRIRAMGAFVIDVNGNPCENLPVRSRKGVTLLLYLIMEKGGRNGAVMRCLSALNVSDEDLEKMIGVFSAAVKKIDVLVTH